MKQKFFILLTTLSLLLPSLLICAAVKDTLKRITEPTEVYGPKEAHYIPCL